MLRQLIDRIAAIEEDAFVAVDEGYLELASRGRGEAWVIGEYAGIAIEVADIDDIGTQRSFLDGQIKALVAECKGGSFLLDHVIAFLGRGCFCHGSVLAVFPLRAKFALHCSMMVNLT